MIGVVIPTRGDRSVFLDKCLEKIAKQTIKPDMVIVVNEAPKSDAPDITYRYRKGLTQAFKAGCEVVFLMEDDDWYDDDYIHYMHTTWKNFGKPQVLGPNETTYYHIGKQEYTVMKHPNRSSAFCTMVTSAVMDMEWPDDDYPFLDLEIWKQLQGKSFPPHYKMCVGIKHGMGICGGKAHGKQFRYQHKDVNFSYLKKVVGPDFKYYKDLLRHKIV